MAQTRDTAGLIATTLDNYMPRMSDNTFKRRFLLDWLLSNGRVNKRGGNSIVEPVMLGTNASVQFYADYDTINTDSQAGFTRALDVWRQLAVSVVYSGIEDAINSGDSAIVSLLDAKMKQAEKSAAKLLASQIVANADGGAKAFNSLVTLVGTGTFMGIDPTVAGQTDWKAVVDTNAGALTLADLSTNINVIGQGDGLDQPDVAVTTNALYVKFEGLLLPQQRFVNVQTAEAGFESLVYRGVTFGWDPDCIAGVVYLLESDTLELVTNEATWMKHRAPVTPTNQDASISLILSYGNLITNNRRNQGKLTGRT